MTGRYTKRQGEYLAFIYYYTRLHQRPPSEADIQAYIGTSAPAVHQMIITLERQGLIQRTPGQARSLRVLLPPESLPDLDGNPSSVAFSTGSFEATFPHIAAWVARQGWIELGYEPNTDTYARALDEGGMVWGGGEGDVNLDVNLRALDEGIHEFMDEQGLR